MASTYLKTQGIVLKRINFKDADRILTIYTEKAGKISARARGIRKLESKKRGHLELFQISQLYLVEGKYWYTITQAEVIESHILIKHALSKTEMGYYVAEVADKLIPEGEENKILFDFLVKTFRMLDQYDSDHLINAFSVKILKLLGFYAQSRTKHENEIVRNYLSRLTVSTYDEIIQGKNLSDEVSQETIHQTFELLKFIIEEELERPLKSRLSFETASYK